MFSSVEEVKAISLDQLYDLVKGRKYNAGLGDILSQTILEKRAEAKSILDTLDVLAENIAYSIRDRVQQEFDEQGEDEYIDEFMNAIAYELGQVYNGEWEHRPDAFWIPSTC